MPQPRSNVVITGGARMSSLTAEIEAGEVAIIKYIASCYRRASGECNKWKVVDCSILFILYVYLVFNHHLMTVEGTGIQCIKGLPLWPTSPWIGIPPSMTGKSPQPSQQYPFQEPVTL